MKQYLRALQLVVTLLFTLPCTAIGQVSVEAKLDTADILIGEQVQLEVKCAVNAKQKVNFPFFNLNKNLLLVLKLFTMDVSTRFGVTINSELNFREIYHHCIRLCFICHSSFQNFSRRQGIRFAWEHRTKS